MACVTFVAASRYEAVSTVSEGPSHHGSPLQCGICLRGKRVRTACAIAASLNERRLPVRSGDRVLISFGKLHAFHEGMFLSPSVIRRRDHGYIAVCHKTRYTCIPSLLGAHPCCRVVSQIVDDVVAVIQPLLRPPKACFHEHRMQ